MGVEYLGADTLVDTRIADHSFIVRLPGRADVNIGDDVQVDWDAAAVHWFDLSSECRIDR
jgi:sn-glycerol 3-phosphate transport system ATP-binding protein